MTPLVLVHGFMGGSAQWWAQGPLGQRGRVIAIDLPGFGARADAEPINSIGAFADWVLEDLARQGVEDFDLLGHSMGGMVAQEMAARAPDRLGRLILAGTGAQGALPGRFEPIETSMARAEADGAKATAERIAATWFLQGTASAGYPACAEVAVLAQLPALLAGLVAMRDWDGRDQLAQIKAPTLVIWGDCDRTYPWAQTQLLWQQIAGAALAVMPDCAHAIHAENPSLFNTLVAEFLDRDRDRG